MGKSGDDRVHVLGGWPFSVFQQQSPAAVHCLERTRVTGYITPGPGILLDKADIRLAPEGAKASEQKTGNGRQCAPQEGFQRYNRPRSWLKWKGYQQSGAPRHYHPIAEATERPQEEQWAFPLSHFHSNDSTGPRGE